MPNSPVFNKGQRVCIKENKYGILHFYGNTFFADGLWCGIELDEAVGENDGMINNTRYFTCKGNYGTFVPASETIIINIPESENDSNGALGPICLTSEKSCFDLKAQGTDFCAFSISCNSRSSPKISEKNTLNESYTISFGCSGKNKLSVVSEEKSEYIKYLDAINLSACTNIADLSKYDKLSLATSTMHEKELSNQNFKENYDSDESLGILPDLLEDLTWDSLIFDSDKLNKNLPSTMSHHYHAKELFSECQTLEPKTNIEELLTSPNCIMANSLCVESPVLCDTSNPKYASTPKHKTNYSYTIDDEVFSLTQNLSCLQLNEKVSGKDCKKNNLDFTLNKTNVFQADLDSVTPYKNIMSTSVRSDIDKNRNAEQNTFNKICNVELLDFGQNSLNKTFGNFNVLDKKSFLSTVMNESMVKHWSKLDSQAHSMEVLKSNYNHFIPHINLDQCDGTSLHSDLYEENNLNVTWDHVNAPNTVISLDKNLKCTNFSENKKCPINILNTTLSYPQELGKTQQLFFMSENKTKRLNVEENVIVHQSKAPDILNRTYGKANESQRLDADVKTLKYISSLEESMKPSQIGTKNKKTENLPSVVTDVTFKKEFRNKVSSSDNKKNLKSVGCFNKTDITNIGLKKKLPQRKSLASNTYISSEVHNTKVKRHSYAKSLSPKCSLKDNTVKNSSSNIRIIDLLSHNDLNENTSKDSPLKSELSDTKGKEIKSVSRGIINCSQESPLNETITLPSVISDIQKTVVKKPRSTMHLSYLNSSFDPCKVPLCKNRNETVLRISKNKSEIPQKSKKYANCLSFGTDLRKSSAVLEVKKRVSKLPQKTSLRKAIPLSNANDNNIERPQNIMPGVKPVSIMKGGSQIPSISHVSRKYIGEKSSRRIPRRTETSIPKPSQYNLR